MTSFPTLPFRREVVAICIALAWALSGWFATIVWWLNVHGYDTHAYWVAWSQDLYEQDNYVAFDRYLYSPVFAQVLKPLTLLPYPAFRGIWLIAMVAAFLWLAHPLRLRWRIPFLLVFCTQELVLGNVYAFMGVMAVLGTRGRWWAWLFGVFTKPVLGALGFVWHVSRGEWRDAARLIAASAAVAAVSAVLAPHLWVGWVETLQAMGEQTRHLYPLRLAGSFALTVVGARTGRAWLLVPAMLLTGSTGFNWVISPLSLLVALPRLRQVGTATRNGSARPGVAARAA